MSNASGKTPASKAFESQIYPTEELTSKEYDFAHLRVIQEATALYSPGASTKLRAARAL